MIKNKIDLRKQNQGIVPNIVHSFDASNIALLVKGITADFNMNHKMNLLTIHDCFATNANDVDSMVLQVKLAFLSLYSDKSFITTYHNFILDYIHKTGYLITNKQSEGQKISYVVTDKVTLRIPNIPQFKMNPNLRWNILGSQYFIN
jgi:DNA-directed RNA polymerase